MSWRMERMCSNCPFAKSGPGRALARRLPPGRMADIKRGLLRGEHFTCHKTTHETGDGSDRMCAGAIEWQNERGVTSQLQRTCERIDAIAGRR